MAERRGKNETYIAGTHSRFVAQYLRRQYGGSPIRNPGYARRMPSYTPLPGLLRLPPRPLPKGVKANRNRYPA